MEPLATLFENLSVKTSKSSVDESDPGTASEPPSSPCPPGESKPKRPESTTPKSIHVSEMSWIEKMHYTSVEQENKRWPPPPIGAPISCIRFRDLKVHESRLPMAKITDVTVVGSLNLLGGPDPTMLIPGIHRKFDPPRTRYVPKDKGKYLRNVSAACYPRHPLEPGVLAAMHMNLGHLMEKPPHIVTSPGAFASLSLALIARSYSVRILAQEIDGTLFLWDHRNSPFQQLTGVVGHGHNFVRCFTSRDESAAPSNIYERVLSYQFGRHRMLVQYDSDAYMDDGQDLKPINDNFIDDHEDPRYAAESAATMRKPFAVPNYPPEVKPEDYPSHLKIKKVGTEVDQSCTLEIGTQSTKNLSADSLQKETQALWVKQTAKFLAAYHTNGLFHKFIWYDLKEALSKWENENAQMLALLDELFVRIRQEVSKSPNKRAELIFDDEKTAIFIRAQGDGVEEAISEETRNMWMSHISHDDEELESREQEDGQENEEDDQFIRWTLGPVALLDRSSKRTEDIKDHSILQRIRENDKKSHPKTSSDIDSAHVQHRHPKTLGDWRTPRQNAQEKDGREGQEKYRRQGQDVWKKREYTDPSRRVDVSQDWRQKKAYEPPTDGRKPWSSSRQKTVTPAQTWRSGWTGTYKSSESSDSCARED